jgi:hypothetical protein
MAFRALLFAVFGGVIGAAPAAPPAGAGTGSGGCVDPRSQTQKLERPLGDLCSAARPVAGAPPAAGVSPFVAPCPSFDLDRPPHAMAGAPLAPGGVDPIPPRALVRAGLLGLPPPLA